MTYVNDWEELVGNYVDESKATMARSSKNDVGEGYQPQESDNGRSQLHKLLKKTKEPIDPFQVRLTEKDRKALKRDLTIQKIIDKEGYKKSMKRIEDARKAENSSDTSKKEKKHPFRVGDVIHGEAGTAKVIGVGEDGRLEIRFHNGHIVSYNDKTLKANFELEDNIVPPVGGTGEIKDKKSKHLTGSTGPR